MEQWFFKEAIGLGIPPVLVVVIYFLWRDVAKLSVRLDSTGKHLHRTDLKIAAHTGRLNTVSEHLGLKERKGVGYDEDNGGAHDEP